MYVNTRAHRRNLTSEGEEEEKNEETKLTVDANVSIREDTRR